MRKLSDFGVQSKETGAIWTALGMWVNPYPDATSVVVMDNKTRRELVEIAGLRFAAFCAEFQNQYGRMPKFLEVNKAIEDWLDSEGL